MRTLPWLLVLGLLVGCGETHEEDAEEASDDDTTTGADDDVEVQESDLADLAELSDGECPEMPESGTYTISSGGLERDFTVLLPDELEPDAPLVFFFHGLLSPDYNPEPGAETAAALNLQATANETGAIFVLPDSRVMNVVIMDAFMWEVQEADDLDLVLYDDLRTCMVTDLEADIARVSATGFSGGSLFVTVLARERGDTLASILEMSGGSDIEVVSMPIIARYDTPAQAMPALVVSGGEDDGWPEGFAVINFDEATDNLETSLKDDGHFVVRCQHTAGHTVTSTAMNTAESWLTAHTYGEPSPFEGAGIDSFGDWCEVVD